VRELVDRRIESLRGLIDERPEEPA